MTLLGLFASLKADAYALGSWKYNVIYPEAFNPHSITGTMDMLHEI